MECPTISCFLLLLSIFFALADGGSVGVNYGRVANDLPSPAKVVQLLKSNGFNRVKLFDTEPSVLQALAGSGIKVVVALPNELLHSVAKQRSVAYSWVKENILAYHPSTTIEAIAIGNEVFVDPQNTTKFLVPAMRKVHAALKKFKLDSAIKVSSPIALSALQSSYPSSAGSFKTELVEPVIKPMLQFLRRTGSYIMMNAYPFFAYAANSDVISLDYALFRDNPGTVDSGNGLRYMSLFDAEIDAVYAALSSLKYDDLKVVVSETGWPSKGDEKEIGASVANAAAYNGNLIRRVVTGGGTPMKPKVDVDVYLFALFNENEKTGPTSEHNYGLFYPSEEKVYDVPFSLVGTMKPTDPIPPKGHEVSTPVKPPTDPIPPKGHGVSTPVKGGENQTGETILASWSGQMWCVANVEVGETRLQAALDYACGEGGADCNPIQPGAGCFNPNTLEAHASFALNSFYQKKGRATGTCDFQGAARVVTQPPKFGTCEFPTGY